MKELLERFYRFSVSFRLFNTIALLLVASILLALWSISSFMKTVSGGSRGPSIYLDDLPQTIPAEDIPVPIREYLESLRAMDAAINQLRGAIPKDLLKTQVPESNRLKDEFPPKIMASLEDAKLTLLEETIASTTRIGLEPLLAFACRYSPENPPLHFRRFRQRAYALTALLKRRKTENPSYSAIPIVETLLRQSLLLEMTHRVLIGKMVAVALHKILDQTLLPLVEAGLLATAELKTVLAHFDVVDSCQLSFREVMNWEFQFMKQSYFRLYRDHSFGCLVFDTVLGNPLDPFEEMLGKMEQITRPEDFTAFVASHRRNLLFQIMVPNFVVARERILAQQALRRILRMAMQKQLGSPVELEDPFNHGRMAITTVDGREIRYSVGPNLRDDKRQEDDVFFPVP